MIFKAVIFDLDGTLLDTLDDIANSAEEVLAKRGFPSRTRAEYQRFIGQGVAKLFHQALPEDAKNEAQIEACVRTFRDVYARRWHEVSQPYQGVIELLEGLTERGIAMAVLSNKPDDFTRACVDHYFAAFNFAAIFGQREGVPRKPDPTAALEITAAMSLQVEQFLFLGDTAIDMQTAQAANMLAVGASWGFRERSELELAGADAIIDEPRELLRYFPS